MATFPAAVVMLLFSYTLPKIMRWLSGFQGATTQSRLDRAMLARSFFFQIFSNFVVYSLIGVGISKLLCRFLRNVNVY